MIAQAAPGLVYSFAMIEPVGVALPTLRRLPLYLDLVEERRKAGEEWISSEALARRLGLSAILVRKDLGAVGALGSPKRGFPTAATAEILKSLIRADELSAAFLVGAGALAEAVLDDASLARRGFEVVALFHPAPAAVGKRLRSMEVLSLSKLPDLSRRMGIKLAILAIEPEWGAETSEALAASQIAGVLDVTGAAFPLPAGLAAIRQSFGTGLAALAGEVRIRKI